MPPDSCWPPCRCGRSGASPSRAGETLGVEVVEGRTFERSDTDDAPEVALLNRAAAELLWPRERALGRELMLVRGLDPITVIGIVEDHRVHGVADEGVPYLYQAAAQSPHLLADQGHLVARATARPGTPGTP